jgi:hypothetical protein
VDNAHILILNDNGTKDDILKSFLLDLHFMLETNLGTQTGKHGSSFISYQTTVLITFHSFNAMYYICRSAC